MYRGFQRQKSGIPTVQSTVEQAVFAVTRQDVTVIAAGRTDSGVHATGQVIAFDVEWRHTADALMNAINACLPVDIVIQDISEQAGFHPRFDAKSRRYQYHIVHANQRHPLLRNLVWCVWGELDFERLQQAAQLLIGEHDFATFGNPPQGDNTVRTVFVSEWRWQASPYGQILVYTIEANAFLNHMVRRIVGTLVDVGRGRMTIEAFESAFKEADLAHAGTLAPPQGLVLDMVRYR